MSDVKRGRQINLDDIKEAHAPKADNPSFGTQVPLDALLDEPELPPEPEEPVRPKKRRGLAWLFLSLFSILILTELALSVWATLQTAPLLGALYISVLLLGGLFCVRFVVTQLSALSKIKTLRTRQNEAKRLLASEQTGEAHTWLIKAGASRDFIRALPAHYTDKEAISHFERSVLKEKDAEVERLIKRFATESAVLVAISPLAVVDMLAVLWRASRLVDGIARIYGVPVGPMVKWRLYKDLVGTLVFVGGTELVMDLAATSVSAELLGKLSLRASQGLSAGILTARIGRKALAYTRPVPLLEDKTSFLNDVCKHILAKVVTRNTKTG